MYSFHRLTTLHVTPSLSLVVLIDGLQAPNIPGKDDLHHQICHQSYESKHVWYSSYSRGHLYLNDNLCVSEIIALMFLCLYVNDDSTHLLLFLPALQTCSPDCGKVHQKGEGIPSISGHCSVSPYQAQMNSGLTIFSFFLSSPV